MLKSPYHGGHLEVIVGPMFSGKSEELIRRLNRAVIARQRVAVFKPAIDDRYHVTHVASHGGHVTPATAVLSTAQIRDLLSGQGDLLHTEPSLPDVVASTRHSFSTPDWYRWPWNWPTWACGLSWPAWTSISGASLSA